MTATKKILVITPRFPYPEAGACEQDRAEGLRQLKRLGFEVRVIAKYFDWQSADEIRNHWPSVPLELIPYQSKKTKRLFTLTPPTSWDGAAMEYYDPAMQRAVIDALDSFRPDVVWFDYSYLWPLYPLVKKRGVPIVARSINFEAFHYLDEDGRTLMHYLKFVPKFFTEVTTARAADVLFAITPNEERLYRRVGGKNVVTLPLRSLATKPQSHTPRPMKTLHAVFSGSTYNVAHNRQALEFIVKELAPTALREWGTSLVFHVTGAKVPADMQSALPQNVRMEGFVDDLDRFLAGMDIALAPSFFGAGMQQKIFEPLMRGFPTVTNARGLAGYDFVPGTDVLVGASVEEYVDAFSTLRSYDRRVELSANAKKKSHAQFSQTVVDQIVSTELQQLL